MSLTLSIFSFEPLHGNSRKEKKMQSGEIRWERGGGVEMSSIAVQVRYH